MKTIKPQKTGGKKNNNNPFSINPKTQTPKVSGILLEP